MQLNQKQIENILSLSTDYYSRSIVQQKIDDYVPIASDMVLRSLQSGLEPMHIVAFKSHTEENNMLQFRHGFNPKELLQTAASSLADSSDGYWDIMYEIAEREEKEKFFL